MRNRTFTWILTFGLLVVLVTFLAAPLTARAAGLNRLVVGGNYTLEQGEVLNEDLTILGGNATLEEGSIVKGSAFLLGGRLEVNGVVQGDILAAGGTLVLGSEARVEGDVNIAGAVLDRDPEAIIEGKLVTETNIPFTNTHFDGLWTPFQWWLDGVWNVFWFIGLAFGLAALAVLVLMFFEEQVENAARTVVLQPAASTGLGCLTMVVLPLALFIMILTICLLPAAAILLLLAGVAITFGWIALGYEVGRRLANQFHQEWAPAFTAGIGTFFLVLACGLLNLIPCIGWVFSFAVTVLGIGTVLLTRFGTQDYAAMAGTVRPVPSPNQML